MKSSEEILKKCKHRKRIYESIANKPGGVGKDQSIIAGFYVSEYQEIIDFITEKERLSPTIKMDEFFDKISQVAKTKEFVIKHDFMNHALCISFHVNSIDKEMLEIVRQEASCHVIAAYKIIVDTVDDLSTL